MYWRDQILDQLSKEQWESLCDGCGKCCLQKLQDEESLELIYTAVACRLLDLGTCRCENFAQRLSLVEHCSDLYTEFHSGDLSAFEWLPTSCAYRLRSDGQALPEWHHLESGSRDTIHEVGESVRGRVLSENDVHPDEIEEFIIQWVEI